MISRVPKAGKWGILLKARDAVVDHLKTYLSEHLPV